MTEQRENSESATLQTDAAPHVVEPGATTRRMMFDVLIGLVPVALAAIWFFRGQALLQMSVCLFVCVITETMACKLRGRWLTLADGSVVITALILAFSLPPTLPLYATVLGAFVAVALGKMVFGGLGHNIFNPAMVGRAFLMVCFPAAMASWSEPITVHATSRATPLAAAKFSDEAVSLLPLVSGNTSGCLGETSATAVLLGGAWLLLRRAGDWRLSIGMLGGVSLIALLETWLTQKQNPLGIAGHLAGGAVMFGAFFIVTDPVTSPITKAGRWIFGLLAGALTMVIRLFAGYPEGVMFAVLVCNAISPLLNRWTTPRPVGGRASTA